MRNIYFLICFVLSAGTIGFFSPFFDINFTGSSAEGSSYAVEIAKYKYPVYTDYFEDLDDVVELSGKAGEYHYLSGITDSKSEAESLVKEMKLKGYSDAKFVDLNSEFSSEQLAGIIPPKMGKQDQTKKQKITDQTIQKNKSAELAIGKLTNIGNAYFYTILLQKSKDILNAESFAPYNSVKVLEVEGKYHYLFGRFEDVDDAQKYLKDEIQVDFPYAQVAILNKGELSEVRIAKPQLTATNSGGDNMGRKMRGKEFVDYYYELGQLKISKKPLYVIEIGTYNNEELANEAVQKLKDLGFTNARIKDPLAQKTIASAPSPSADAHFTIQVFAGKRDLKSTRLHLKGVTRTFDQHDELYRYFYGDYNNYWVCRRELREVRKKGFGDAFVVKL